MTQRSDQGDVGPAPREGSDDEFARRVQSLCSDRLLARIRLLMGPEARRQAESGDFLGEVLVATLKARSELERKGPEDLLRWMTAVARNRIRVDVRRKRERALDSFSISIDGVPAGSGDGPSPWERADRNDRLGRLTLALESLPEDHRLVIELRDLDERPWKEVADLMGRTEGAVQMLHTRALVGLGRVLPSE